MRILTGNIFNTVIYMLNPFYRFIFKNIMLLSPHIFYTSGPDPEYVLYLIWDLIIDANYWYAIHLEFIIYILILLYFENKLKC